MIREPVVSGQFYPGSAQGLRKQIESFVDKNAKREEAIAAVLPHAGYVYSGRVAVETVSCINLKDTFIILGPNHTGRGEAFSIMTDGSWKTPLGEIRIDERLAKEILKDSGYLSQDSDAHLYEHSIEVELPILQYFKSDFKIVPIVVAPQEKRTYERIGTELAGTLKRLNIQDKVIIIASSDMTHYEPQEQAKNKDMQAIDAILKLDYDLLLERIANLDITMCGYVPVTIMLVIAKAMGAKKSTLIKYETSGQASGDYSSVVGYAGIIIS